MLTCAGLQEIIARYTIDATRVVAALRSVFGYQNLTAAVVSGEISRTGEIEHSTIGKASFQFHGRGCFVDAGKLKIDIELCGETDLIGFDAWRLARYLSETLGVNDIDEDEIQALLEELRRKNELFYSKEKPFFGLYYLPVRPYG